jgi:prepilin-type processing-associated H-X9-DG protein
MVEVLVSIAIVVVLSALISLAILRTKSASKSVVCLQNMRQIGVAIELYASDADNCFPPYGTHWPTPYLTEYNPSDPDDRLEIAKRWKKAVAGYGVKEPQFFSPDDPYTNPQVAETMVPLRPLADDLGGKARLVTSYAVTLSLRFHIIGVSRSSIERPSETPYLAEGLVELKNPPITIHGSRMNILHVDGSVKNYPNTHQFPQVVNPKP